MGKSINLSRRDFLAGGVGAAGLVALAGCSSGSSSSSDTGSSGSSASTASGTTYKIATDTTFAPFEYANADGEYEGIDIDLLAAIAEDQGFDYELDPVGFDAALQAVQSGQDDGVIAGMSITDERKEIFDFSDPYYDSTVCCAAAAGGDIQSLDDLNGQNVAVKNGTMSQSWAQSIADQYGFTMTTFDTSDVMYQDVTAGNSAACFEDTPVMSYAISTGSVDLEIIETVDEDSEYATPYGFAVLKGENGELLDMFNAGLADIKDDGTYQDIIDKYVTEA